MTRMDWDGLRRQGSAGPISGTTTRLAGAGPSSGRGTKCYPIGLVRRVGAHGIAWGVRRHPTGELLPHVSIDNSPWLSCDAAEHVFGYVAPEKVDDARPRRTEGHTWDDTKWTVIDDRTLAWTSRPLAITDAKAPLAGVAWVAGQADHLVDDIMFDLSLAEAFAKSRAISSVASFLRHRYGAGSLPGEDWQNPPTPSN